MNVPKVTGVRKEKSSGGGLGGPKLPSGIGGAILWTVGIALAIGIPLFILMGGVNQLKLIQTMGIIGQNIGNVVSQWIQQIKINFTDTGVYIQP